jgi:hypothetical protein
VIRTLPRSVELREAAMVIPSETGRGPSISGALPAAQAGRMRGLAGGKTAQKLPTSIGKGMAGALRDLRPADVFLGLNVSHLR